MPAALWCCCWALLAVTESNWVTRRQGTASIGTSPGKTIQASMKGTSGNALGKPITTLPPASQEELRDDAKIIGGREARTGEFPWIVSLSWVGGMHFCGGSLLTLQHILSACHCTCRFKDDVDEDLVNVEDVELSAGSLHSRKSSPGSEVQCNTSFGPEIPEIFQDCVKQGGLADCSRRQLSACYVYGFVSIHHIIPGCFLPSESKPSPNEYHYCSTDTCTKPFPDPSTLSVKEERWCKAVGWGTTGISVSGNYVNVSDTLRVVGVQLIGFAECHQLLSNFSAKYQEIDVQSRYLVCAKNDNRSDACKGDSGGGFVCGTYVFGVLSWGPSCGEKNTPSMYGSIDGGWDFIVKSLFSLTSRLLPTSFQWLQTTGSAILIINHVRNI